MEEEKKGNVCITQQERQVLTLIRELGYGELRVLVREGQPYRVEEIRKSIQIR